MGSKIGEKSKIYPLILFLVKRIAASLILLTGVIIVVFVLLRLASGSIVDIILSYNWDPKLAAEMKKDFGLDLPIYAQFIDYFWRCLHGDFGISWVSQRPVLELTIRPFYNSLLLTGTALAMSLAVGIPVGIYSANNRNTGTEFVIRALTIGAVSTPAFVTGFILLYIFSANLHIFPASGTGGLKHFVLPAITLSTFSIAGVARMTRSTMLEVARQDYIRAARSKGLNERAITYRHALRNALVPITTLVGLYFGILVGGSVLTEVVFSWPGLGRLALDAIRLRDIPLIQFSVITITAIIIFVNLTVDILYTIVNPRVRMW